MSQISQEQANDLKESNELNKDQDRGILSPNIYVGWGAGTWIFVSIVAIAVIAFVYVKFIKNQNSIQS